MHRLIGSCNGPNNAQTYCERARDTGERRAKEREKEGYTENRTIGEGCKGRESESMTERETEAESRY